MGAMRLAEHRVLRVVRPMRLHSFRPLAKVVPPNSEIGPETGRTLRRRRRARDGGRVPPLALRVAAVGQHQGRQGWIGEPPNLSAGDVADHRRCAAVG